jgi:hypothetical protein
MDGPDLKQAPNTDDTEAPNKIHNGNPPR